VAVCTRAIVLRCIPRCVYRREGIVFAGGICIAFGVGPSGVRPGVTCAQPNAIGAGPMLVAAPAGGTGAGTASVADESFHWPCTTHPRTAVAIDDRGHLLLVTFDGGHGAVGVTLPQAASYLVNELNARQAMNFDGGGSTAVYVKGRGLANVPSTDSASGPAERAVYDGLMVYGP
jgi:exopolysaccharide biosynthesis protein